ncbi:MAG TPA: hypothetical protein DEH78_12685 [Solibacterales bacterium]|nr:hypothetical protein [Bryobacterales bacterium]
MNRRAFLKSGAIAMFGAGAAPAWLARAASSSEGRARKVLVALFQRGAADGLAMVPPHAEETYYKLRPSIAAPKGEVIDLDGRFGLHPSLAPLKKLWDAKQLAIVQAVGSPDPTRSHFDAQDYMESGTPGVKSTRDGWLNRSLRGEAKSPVRAVGMGQVLPRALRGAQPAVAVASLPNFRLRDERTATAFEQMYAADRGMAAAAKETFEAVRLLRSVPNTPPAAGVSYPGGRLGQSLQQIAQLIKADAGLEVAFADMGGWDTHANQAPQLSNLLSQFGGALAAFAEDLGERMQNVAVVTMSEFGRTAKENGSRGTDHGHANVMFLFGGGVPGGRVYGRWPGLAPEQLYEGRDLAVTTDFRDVLSELASRQLGVEPSVVFPGYQARSAVSDKRSAIVTADR